MLAFMSFPISRKLALAFGLTAVGFAAGGAAVIHQAGSVSAADAAYAQALDRARASDALLAAVDARSMAALALLQQPGAATEARFREAGETLAGANAALQNRFEDATDAARLERLKGLDASYRADVETMLGTSAPAAAQARPRGETLVPPPATQADIAPMTAIARALQASGEASLLGAQAVRNEARAMMDRTLPLALGLPLLLALGAGVFAVRSSASSLRRLGEETSRLVPGASGDLAATLARVGENLKGAQSRVATLETELLHVRAEAAAKLEAASNDNGRAMGEQDGVVAALQDGLTRLSSGDLTCRIEAEFPARYARLREEFNTAAAHLNDMVGRVSQAVSSIANGTSEIGHAADDLSRRTEQQAASLDKTASALDEITATVKHSAENAASVASSVAAARHDTERSGEVMREAVEAMNAIQTSSQQIARIIGVIDEIAFQTNLLALNAGVEAARAGDAGRGFAVVALEVRALAQRSSEAAKEIKGLIGASSSHVGNGVDLVNRSGEVLTRIAAQVTQIDALVQEIAGSAREQSIGIAEVNDAVNKMDRVTQQNAAMVEETTAATLSLRTETEELGRLVSSFHMDTTNGSVAKLRSMSAAMRTPPVAAPAQTARPAAMPAPRAAPVAAASAAAAAAPAAVADDLGWEEF